MAGYSSELLTIGVRALSGNRRKELKVFCIKNVKFYLPCGHRDLGIYVVFRRETGLGMVLALNLNLGYSVSDNCCACTYVCVCGVCVLWGGGVERRCSPVHTPRACRQNRKRPYIPAVKKLWREPFLEGQGPLLTVLRKFRRGYSFFFFF